MKQRREPTNKALFDELLDRWDALDAMPEDQLPHRGALDHTEVRQLVYAWLRGDIADAEPGLPEMTLEEMRRAAPEMRRRRNAKSNGHNAGGKPAG